MKTYFCEKFIFFLDFYYLFVFVPSGEIYFYLQSSVLG